MQTQSERGEYIHLIHFKAVYIEKKKEEEHFNPFFDIKTMFTTILNGKTVLNIGL